MEFFIIIFIAIILVIFFRYLRKPKRWKLPTKPFPKVWKSILYENVAFYNSLKIDEKSLFEHKIQEFLLNCRITGIEIKVEDLDRLLVAASAVIPVFAFPEWRYSNISEVLLYPGAFNDKFETDGPDRTTLGMVGTGYMKGKMILSRPALRLGFSNDTDKRNTAIHEFIHLIDMADGKTDGLPSLLLDKQYVIPWLNLLEKKIDDIYENRSDINPYGGTNRIEFYAVACEYFFERPKLFKVKHPELYSIMTEIFDQEMASRNLTGTKRQIGRNSPCPCNSGIKFKKCCGKEHY